MRYFKKIFLVLFAFFFVLSINVFAKNTIIKDVTIANTSGSVTATKVSVNNDIINPEVIFRNIGDSVSYEITIDDKYDFTAVADNNKSVNVSTSYEVKGKKIFLTMKYENKISDSFVVEPIQLRVGNGTLTNPKTVFYIPILLFIIFFVFTYLFFKHGKKSVLLILLFLPFAVYADSLFQVKINTSNIRFAYSVSFYKDSDSSGNMEDIECLSGEICTLPANAFRRDRYAFLGWATEENGKVAFNDAGSVFNYAGQMLYPVWVYDLTVRFTYTGSVQTYTITESGNYKLEVWGAQGGSYSSGIIGGKGGYSTGVVSLQANDVLYIYVGGQGTGVSSSYYGGAGGFNGGGNGGDGTDDSEGYRGYGGSGGGGATDIRIGSDSIYARVIVAGGGGGVGGHNTYDWGSLRSPGGAGGGTEGIQAGSNDADSGSGTSSNPGLPGTQTSGGAGGAIPTFTSTGTDNTYHGSGGGGGGAGWYGGGGGSSGSCTGGMGIFQTAGISGSFGIGGAGGSNSSTSSYYSSSGGNGSGGSGYIYTSSTASYYPSGCLLNSSYYLTSASTSNGNMGFPSPIEGNEVGHVGNGYAKITLVE